MILPWLFATGSDRRLLATTGIRGPTPWVIAIMSFSIMIIAATGLALANSAGSLRQAIESATRSRSRTAASKSTL